MLILLHSSKTMRPVPKDALEVSRPQLAEKAQALASYLQTLTSDQIRLTMKVSDKLAQATADKVQQWTIEPRLQRPAIDAFLGDIYSGLQVQDWTPKDRLYAQQHLRILSGLYGVLRPLDGIYPYRLEMGYRLPDEPFKNLNRFWGSDIADILPVDKIICNLAAVEYSSAVLPYLTDRQIITPRFMTTSPKTGEPTFVVVHAKIARGAFASWLIRERLDNVADMTRFSEIGYRYVKELSTPDQPVFVCKEFKGLGLSVRLT